MRILGFGEVLWDVFPDKRVIGGAPLNFCAHTVKLGAEADFISAVGRDDLGGETRRRLTALGVGDRFLQDSDAPTGVCLVSLDGAGRPSYELRRGVAYDDIRADAALTAAINARSYDAFYLGTLAARDKTSRAALERILADCEFQNIVFDINIRQSFYDDDILTKGLRACTILKLSRDELGILAPLAGAEAGDGEAVCRALAERYAIRDVLLTLDKDGAMVLADGELIREPNPWDEVVSTVGGGDSFTAAYTYYRLHGLAPRAAVKKALILSSYVVGKTEAIPDYDEFIIGKLNEREEA